MIYVNARFFILETVILRLFFLCNFVIIYKPKTIRKRKVISLILCFLLLIIIDILTNQFATIIFILIMYLILKNKGTKDYFLLNSIILSLLINSISPILASVLTFKMYKSNETNLFVILFDLSITLIITALLNYIFFVRLNLLRKIEESTTYVISAIGIYFYAILISFIYFIQKFEAYSSLVTGILLFLFIQTAISIYLFIYTYNRQKENFEKKLTHDQLENLSQYTAQLDADQKEMHKFKHDYRNILNSLNEIAIEDNNTDLKKSLNELEGYSSKYFSNISMDDFKDLEYVSNTYIKSLLLGKFKIMKANNIDCYFECKSDIDKVSINIFDLIRVLGVSIDNAIEAVKNQKEGKIKIILMNSHDQLDITIQNTVTKNIQINEIKNYGFTTKNNHSGLGLVNIQDIKKKYQNLLVHYDIADNLFSINFVISNKGELK